jgi:hypothetical protein
MEETGTFNISMMQESNKKLDHRGVEIRMEGDH